MKNSCDKLLDTLKNFSPSIGDVRLKKALLDGEEITVYLVSDTAVSEEDKNFIKDSIEKVLNGFTVKIKVAKSVADSDIAKKAILEYLKNHCYSVAHAICENSVKIICGGKKIKYELSLTEGVAEYLERTSVIPSLNEVLEREYSNFFEGEIRSLGEETAPEYKNLDATDDEIEDVKIRYVKMRDVEKYSDSEYYDVATYVADGENLLGKAYFAGTVTELEERVSKKGNKYYRITLDDKSGVISGNYFTSDKTKLQKMERVAVGSVIITRGEMETFNGRPSYSIKGFHFCEFPENYKPKDRPSKKAPDKYSFAFPEPCETSKQDDFFTGETTIPECVKEQEFVVVDIETTGTDVTGDKITEIGAVKIKNGVISESFQILIDPEINLPIKIIELTGITDEMLAGQPKIHEVYPDYFKFLGDAVFVAHNADFDYRFLKRVGRELGYDMKNRCLDTLQISREVLPWLSNHKLNTVCAHYKIEFRHHRALSDAFATAEAFIELMKAKKTL